MADLEALVTAGATETFRVEYKREPWTDNREWCKDISALANTQGGCIIVGMREQDGVAAELIGFDGELDALVQRLTQSAESNLLPRLAIAFDTLQVTNGRKVLLVTTPRSRFAPHQTLQDHRFYKRVNATVLPMSADELRRAFLFSRSVEELCLDAHREHVARVRTPKANELGLFVDFFPLPLDVDRVDPARQDMWKVLEKAQPLFGEYSHNRRVVFDGYVLSGPDGGQFELRVMRSGALLWHHFLVDQPPDSRRIHSKWTAEQLRRALEMVREVHASWKASTPIYACLTLIGCKDFLLTHPARKPISEDHLEFPPLYIEKAETEAIVEIRPWLHRLWNACGVTRCEGYDAQTEEPKKEWLR